MEIAANEIVFHNYALSPFSEKIRKVFALKNISYRSVDQPMWLPRPELTPLTASFRRIPVMQIGADIYCDTSLIARKLDRLHPDPPLYPGSTAGVADLIGAWADKQLIFPVCAPLVFGALAGALPGELIDDRKKMMPGLDVDTLRAAAPGLGAMLAAYLDWIDAALDGKSHLLGEHFTIADAAVFHALWFVHNDPTSAEKIRARPHLAAWMDRVEAMGHGNAVESGAADALAVARDSEPADSGSGGTDVAPGTSVAISADDLPTDVVRGEVVSADTQEIVIRREAADLGTLHMHFPRAGYIVRPG